MCTGVRIINVKTAFGCNVDDNGIRMVSTSRASAYLFHQFHLLTKTKKQQLIFNQLISLNLDRCRAFYLRLYREIPRRCALSG